MKPTLYAILLCFIVCSCTSKQSSYGHEEETLMVEGKRLVNVLGCHDCHSPKTMTEQGPIPNPEYFLAGYPKNQTLPEAFEVEAPSLSHLIFNIDGTATLGPWGISYAANITPHPTGIGGWTFEQFANAMQKGKYKGLENGRHLLPPMPWPGYAQLKEAELKAIFSYLQTLKPIQNQVPTPKFFKP